jgi:hypothetical protein
MDDEAEEFFQRVERVAQAFPRETPTVMIGAAVAFAKRAGITHDELRGALEAAWNAITFEVVQ